MFEYFIKKIELAENAKIVMALCGERRKSCAWCGNMISALHWWCGSEEAIEARGTSLPGVNFCPYWKSDKKTQKLINKFGKLKAVRREFIFKGVDRNLKEWARGEENLLELLGFCDGKE